MPYSDWYSRRMLEALVDPAHDPGPGRADGEAGRGAEDEQLGHKDQPVAHTAKVGVGDGDQHQQDGQDHDVVGASFHAQRLPHRAGDAQIPEHVAQHHRVGGGQDGPQQQRQDHREVEQQRPEPGEQPDDQQRGRSEDQDGDQPVAPQLGELQVDRVQEQHQGQGDHGHDLEHVVVQADRDELEAAVAEQEPEPEKQHRERQGGALHQTGGQGRDDQDPGDQAERGLQLQHRLL